MDNEADSLRPGRRRFWRRLLVAALQSLVLAFYLWTASSSTQPFVFTFAKAANSYGAVMADAFLHGQLSLRINPSPELLALEDPYDPSANARYRQHDLSLYKGKYYAYFTPAPALLFIAPFKLLFGYFIPDNLLAALLCFAGFVFSCLALDRLLRIVHAEPSLPTRLASTLALATVTAVPFLLRRPAIYELSIASGYAFMMAGVYALVTAVTSGRNKWLWGHTAASGLLLGLCILSRPNQLFACGVLIVAFLFARRILVGDTAGTALRLAGCLLAPIALVGTAMCWYNYARFGSVFEFGASYQLPSLHPHRIAVMAPIYIPLGLYHYVFQIIPFDLRFPFFHAVPPVAPIDIPFPYYYEPTIGLLNLPVYWLLCLSLFSVRSIWKVSPAFLLLSVSMIAASLATLCVVSSMVGTTMRYIVDFSPLLLLATIALFLVARPLVFSPQGSGPTVSRLSYHVPVLISVVISIAISMTGYYDNFRSGNPQLYQKLERMFSFDLGGLARRFPPTPSVPPDVPSTPRILAIRAHNRTDAGQDGSSFSLGRTETEVEVYSPRMGIAHFTASAYPGARLREYVTCRIRISADETVQELTIRRGQEAFDFSVPVQAGTTVIRVLALDPPESETPGDRDTGSLLTWFGVLRLVDITSE